ncbi:MAG: hypothetical protein GWN99_02695 [Gemmatimonadetes bacterium]|uniref:Uncharacterized protein n=1 Tax=Candidatus Kutchimonas denitrificans TaxID=3056748 RepID=A0AAE4Z8D0_9BACT|nr:hypothetical protein [Gemmatimonadota bacterium]NIR74863.1 hypothetical protein [Candidatus Kutchimonas denitrificans]NIR99974.1 hypothetical protein [Gemmatimonadota bacterium]NIT65558.1 hypothetical protein [Gemmatimonadota bacterium]NIU52528.1 hypothetical protein [Gemmatimonadota bacterium]
MAQQRDPTPERGEALRVASDPRLLPPAPASIDEPFFIVSPLPLTSGQDEARGNYALQGAILGGAIPFLILLTSDGMEAYAGFLLIVPGMAVGGLVGSLADRKAAWSARRG